MIEIMTDISDGKVNVHASYDCENGNLIFEALVVLAEAACKLKEQYPSNWTCWIKDKTLEDLIELSNMREGVKENEQQ